MMLCSVSQDQTAMIWEWKPSTNSVDCVHLLQGHERGLECVGIDKARTFVVTGGWDTVLKIWSSTSGETQKHVILCGKHRLDHQS
jgi:ribosome biogenesis protein YTM1